MELIFIDRWAKIMNWKEDLNETCTTSLSRKNDNCYSEENESRRSSRAQTEGAKLVYWNSRGLTRLVLAAVSLPHYPRGWSIPLEMRQRFRINARDRALTSPFAFPRANSTRNFTFIPFRVV